MVPIFSFYLFVAFISEPVFFFYLITQTNLILIMCFRLNSNSGKSSWLWDSRYASSYLVTLFFPKEKFNLSNQNDVTDIISLSLVLLSFLIGTLTQPRINYLERENFTWGTVQVWLPSASSGWDGFDWYGNAQTTMIQPYLGRWVWL